MSERERLLGVKSVDLKNRRIKVIKPNYIKKRVLKEYNHKKHGWHNSIKQASAVHNVKAIMIDNTVRLSGTDMCAAHHNNTCVRKRRIKDEY